MSRINIVEKGKRYDKDLLKSVFGDFDNDGIINIDDIAPLNNKIKGKVEQQVSMGDVFESVLDLRQTLQSQMNEIVDQMDDFAPEDAQIYARTKTPFSIFKKLVDKRLLDENKGLTDLVGTTIAVDDFDDLITVKESIEKGALGEVLDFEDYYSTPKGGYRAFHYIVRFNGFPMEIQLKTKRQKEINEMSHDFYKAGTLNAEYMKYLTELAVKADEGDIQKQREFDRIIKLKTTRNKLGNMKKGGSIYNDSQKFAKGGSVTEKPVELKNYGKNILGTVDFDMHIKGMKGYQNWSVYPISSTEKNPLILVQSDKRFAYISPKNGRGVSSITGNTSIHLQKDIANGKATYFKLTGDQLEQLKSEIRKTSSANAGNYLITSDNSGADKLENGGEITVVGNPIILEDGYVMVELSDGTYTDGDMSYSKDMIDKKDNVIREVLLSFKPYTKDHPNFDQTRLEGVVDNVKDSLKDGYYNRGGLIKTDNGKYIHKPSGYMLELHLGKGEEDWNGSTYNEDRYVVLDEDGMMISSDHEPLEVAKDTLLDTLEIMNEEYKKGGFINNMWYEVGIDKGDDYGTMTIATFKTKKEAEAYKTKVERNPELAGEEFYKVFVDKWKMVDGLPTPVYSNGGKIKRSKSAINKDRKYTSNEKHEQRYASKRKSAILRYLEKGGKINTKSIAVKNAERELKKAKQSKITSWIDKASRNLDKVYEAEEMIDNLRGQYAKGGEIEYSNEENELVGNFLLNTTDGKSILRKVKNPKQLEQEVRKYHSSKGIPNWDFDDDEDGGIDWVTFSDLYDEIQGHYADGGEVDNEEVYNAILEQLLGEREVNPKMKMTDQQISDLVTDVYFEVQQGKSLEKVLLEQLLGEREVNPKMKMTDQQIGDLMADVYGEHPAVFDKTAKAYAKGGGVKKSSSTYSRRGNITNKSNQKEFENWISEGNALEIEDGIWIEQTTQWKKRFSLPELKEFYFREFVNYKNGGKVPYPFKKVVETDEFEYYMDLPSGDDDVIMIRKSDGEIISDNYMAENALYEDILSDKVTWSTPDMDYNIREIRKQSMMKFGGKTKLGWKRDRIWTSKEPHEQAYKKKRKSAIRNHAKDKARNSQEPHEIAIRKMNLGGRTSSFYKDLNALKRGLRILKIQSPDAYEALSLKFDLNDLSNQIDKIVKYADYWDGLNYTDRQLELAKLRKGYTGNYKKGKRIKVTEENVFDLAYDNETEEFDNLDLTFEDYLEGEIDLPEQFENSEQFADWTEKQKSKQILKLIQVVQNRIDNGNFKKGGKIDANRHFTQVQFDRLTDDIINDFVGEWSGDHWIIKDISGVVRGTWNPTTELLEIKGEANGSNPLVRFIYDNSYLSIDEYDKLEYGGEIVKDGDGNMFEILPNRIKNFKVGDYAYNPWIDEVQLLEDEDDVEDANDSYEIVVPAMNVEYRYNNGGSIGRDKWSKVMTEFRNGELKSSSGDIVTDKEQAMAIAYSEARKADKKYAYSDGGSIEETERFIEFWSDQPDDVIVTFLAESNISGLEKIIDMDRTIDDLGNNMFLVDQVYYLPNKDRNDLIELIKSYDDEYGLGGLIVATTLGAYFGYKVGRSMSKSNNVFAVEKKLANKLKSKAKKLKSK